MSDQKDQADAGISDEDLPEDLQPNDDNPLAKPLTGEDDTKPLEELDVFGGKTPEQSAESGDSEDGSDATHDSED
jgi:hypothetical protein